MVAQNADSQNVQTLWIRLPRTQMAQIMVQHTWMFRLFLLFGICTVFLWQDYYGKGNSRKFYWNTVGKKFQIGECLFVDREKELFLSVYVDDFIHLAGKKQNIDFNVESIYERNRFGRANDIP